MRREEECVGRGTMALQVEKGKTEVETDGQHQRDFDSDFVITTKSVCRSSLRSSHDVPLLNRAELKTDAKKFDFVHRSTTRLSDSVHSITLVASVLAAVCDGRVK